MRRNQTASNQSAPAQAASTPNPPANQMTQRLAAEFSQPNRPRAEVQRLEQIEGDIINDAFAQG